MVASAVTTQDVLERARAGDGDAFGELVAPYRRELHLHCYRLMGSLVDAEDVLQETLLAAWRGLGGYEGRSSLRAWLYRIATNRCLNAIRDHRRHVPAEPMPPFTPPEPTRRGEATWLTPYPESLLERIPDAAAGPDARYHQREAVELAFVAGLQLLPPRQAAALVLCDVLAYPVAEAAAMLDTSATAVKGTLQRARATMARTAPAGEAPAPGSAAERAVTRRFADAFVGRDLDALIALLTDDAWLAMPPAPHEYHGGAAIRGFLAVSGGWRAGRRLELVPTRANTQPAFACFIAGEPAGLMVLTLRGDRIRGMTRFHDNDMLLRYGLLTPWTG